MKGLNILLLSANPKNTGKLRLQEEEREIKEQLRFAGYRNPPISTEVAVRTKDLYRAIVNHKPTVIHFSGHGSESEGLILEDAVGRSQPINSFALAELFELASPSVRCVILNACYSSVQAEAIAKHIEYVIGMSSEIQDVSAIEFSTGFYSALGAGENFEYAFKIGCIAMRLCKSQEMSIPKLIKRKEVCPSYIKATTSHSTKPQRQKITQSGDVVVVGPRASGKTTYLAALSTWSETGFSRPIVSVSNSSLGMLSLPVLQEGYTLSPTCGIESIYLPIEVDPNPKNLSLESIRKPNIELLLDYSDSPGEIYNFLVEKVEEFSWLEDFRKIMKSTSQVLFLVAAGDCSKEDDRRHSMFLYELQRRIRISGKRIAVTFSKADRTNLWNAKYDAENHARNNFPRMYSTLQKLSDVEGCSIEFFACSAFGMKGIPPKANVNTDKEGYSGGIADPFVWQPFGLAGPIYWLATGRKDTRLEGYKIPKYLRKKSLRKPVSDSRANPKRLLPLAVGLTLIILSTRILPRFVFSKRQNVSIESSSDINYSRLKQYLEEGDLRKADQETYEILLLLAGSEAYARGYIDTSNMGKLSCAELSQIDSYWREASGGLLGFSAQQVLYEQNGLDWQKMHTVVQWGVKEGNSFNRTVERKNNLETRRLDYPESMAPNFAEPVPGHLPFTANIVKGIEFPQFAKTCEF